MMIRDILGAGLAFFAGWGISRLLDCLQALNFLLEGN